MWIECGHWLTFGSTEWIENGSEQWMMYQYQSVRRMVSSNRRICQLRMGKKSHFLCYTKSKGKKSHFLANNQMCNKRQQLSSIYNWQQHRLGLEKNNLLTAEGVGKADLLFENWTKNLNAMMEAKILRKLFRQQITIRIGGYCGWQASFLVLGKLWLYKLTIFHLACSFSHLLLFILHMLFTYFTCNNFPHIF